MYEDPYSAESRTDSDLRLIDLKVWQKFDGAVFAVVEKKLRYTANDVPYLQLRLRDNTGICNAKWFGAPEDILQILGNTKLVKVRGQVDGAVAFRGDLKLSLVEACEEPDDLSPFLTPLPEDHNAHKSRFFDIVRSIRHPHLKALLKSIFDPKSLTWSQFCDAPAAKGMHHAYRGGLLEHSGEVAILCDRNASVLPHIDRDLLVTAALLHDIGKLEEMEIGLSSGQYTHAGQLVGHVVLGTCTIAHAAQNIDGFPAESKHELMHLILSHHGRIEHGAARWPMCAEAMILSLCDLMSAKTAQCRDASLATDGDDFPKTWGWDSERVYVGAMRRVQQDKDAL
jgi:3'-5' exoribonuclease